MSFYLGNHSLFNAFKIYCHLNAQNEMIYKPFLLAVGRKWVTDHSGECSGGPIPGPNCGISKRAPHKDPPCWLSSKINKRILGEIILTGLKEMLPESVESGLPGESKHGIVIIDVCFSVQKCLLYCLSHSNKILECFSKTHTKFQINTVSVKQVVDI